MSRIKTLQATITQLTQGSSGILAADESHLTLEKRFSAFDIDYTLEARRQYRELLFTTPQLEKYINGVILFEETLAQTDMKSRSFIDILKEKGIVPGIKVDQGLAQLPFSSHEKITQGLDELSERLENYSNQGAQFAKWRAIFKIQDKALPSLQAIQANAHRLALYAAYCQEKAMVPIIEPEVLLEGTHNLARCQKVTEQVLHEVFDALYKQHVLLEYIMLKPSMVTMGDQCQSESFDPKHIAQATLQVLRRTVPSSVPSINFLSGGQTPEQATQCLYAINRMMTPKPWRLNFSYGRALQLPVLKAWQGYSYNIEVAQQALYDCARSHVEAIQG